MDDSFQNGHFLNDHFSYDRFPIGRFPQDSFQNDSFRITVFPVALFGYSFPSYLDRDLIGIGLAAHLRSMVSFCIVITKYRFNEDGTWLSSREVRHA